MIINKNLKKLLQLLIISSMFFAQSFAMQNALTTEGKCQQKTKDQEGIERPFSMPFFKQKTVSLVSSDEGVLSLAFDQSTEACITHYLLDGKPAGKLLQINDAVHFQGQESSQYDFVLKSCLSGGLLTVATQGNFAFEKPVTVSSASLGCRSVEFFDKFSATQGLTLDVNHCNNFGDVACTDILFKGKYFNCMSGSSLTVLQSAALFSIQKILNDGTISCMSDALINTNLLENWGILIPVL